MTNTKICPICGKTVDASRLARYPSAVVCGRRTCSLKYRRAAFNRVRKRYRDRRLASDPAFRLREKQTARERYVKSRLRLGKTPALREPVAHDLTAIGTFLAAIRRRASEALAGAARAVRSICG